MQECDCEGVVPNSPPHHCSKQKAAEEVGELQGKEVYWRGTDIKKMICAKFKTIVDDVD